MNFKDPTHYSPEQWADYVRHITPDDERAAMEAHLASGCPQCTKASSWLQSLQQAVTVASNSEEVPDSLVSQAKAIFRPSRQPVESRPQEPGWIDRLETLVASLVLVSSGDWLPDGVRSGSVSAGERLLYRAGDYTVDLTMDEGLAFGQAGEIIGQILDSQHPDPGTLEGVLVQLRSGTKVLGETETNRFGEFVLQRPTAKPSVLRFALSGQGKKIELQLKSRKENATQ